MEPGAKELFDRADKLGPYPTACALLYRILDEYPNDVEARAYAHWLLSQAESTAEKRLEQIKKLVDAHPDNQSALNRFKLLQDECVRIARQDIASEDYLKARKLLDKLLDANPKNKEALLLSCDIAKTDLELTLCLEEVLAIDPADDFALRRLNELKDKLNQPTAPNGPTVLRGIATLQTPKEHSGEDDSAPVQNQTPELSPNTNQVLTENIGVNLANEGAHYRVADNGNILNSPKALSKLEGNELDSKTQASKNELREIGSAPVRNHAIKSSPKPAVRNERRSAKVRGKQSAKIKLPLLPVNKIFKTFDDFRSFTEKTIADGRVEEVVVWLEQRIKGHPGYRSNFILLASILEKRLQKVDEAFGVLCSMLEHIKNGKNANEKSIDKSCRTILAFCKRNKRVDLGKKAYLLVREANPNSSFLDDFKEFAPVAAEVVVSTAEETQQDKTSLSAPSDLHVQERQTEALNNHPRSQPVEKETKPEQNRDGLFDNIQELRRELKAYQATNLSRGRIGMFIDHENLIMAAQDVNEAKGRTFPDNQYSRAYWLDGLLKQLLNEAKKRFGEPTYKVTVGFWGSPFHTLLLPTYIVNGFTPFQPETFKWKESEKEQGEEWKNAVDFKLTDEVRRTQYQALEAGIRLSQVIFVSGDGHYAHIVKNLVSERVGVQIWCVDESKNRAFEKLIGAENFWSIDHLCINNDHQDTKSNGNTNTL